MTDHSLVASSLPALWCPVVDPRFRTTLFTLAAAAAAIYVGSSLAQENYFWPFAALAVALSMALVRITRLPIDVIILGLVVFGYIFGNRGFAQLSLYPGLPLFPAEATLLFAGGWWIVACAFEKRAPLKFDAVNLWILLLILAGTIRLVFDIREYRFMAIRDYAMIYYAIFFFITQRIAAAAVARRYLVACLCVAAALLLPVLQLYNFFPDFFMRTLTVRGVPLIFYKGDLVFTFLAVGSLVLFHFAKPAQRRFAWPLAVAMFLFVAAGDNRASLAGAVIAMAFLALARRWKYPAVNAGAATIALAVLVLIGVGFDNDWARNKVDGLTDRVQSVLDFQGMQTYRSDEFQFKGDNNRFRLVWWASVARETWDTNPFFGLGFGYDLARNFVREYNPELIEEFTARSPHNIFLSMFGRLGMAGLVIWTGLVLTLAKRAWHSVRRTEDSGQWGIWMSVGAIIVSACFGVVLEGPMGAVPFWILVGLACTPPVPDETPATRVAAGEDSQTA